MFQGILLIFLAALLSPILLRLFKSATGWVLAVFPLVFFLYLAQFYPQIHSGQSLTQVFPWVSFLGVSLSFHLDGLSLLFAFLVSGIGTFILIYAGAYLEGNPRQGQFFSFLLLFMASMLGLVLADNLMALFVFWELTSISSYLLIGFNHGRQESRDGALQALLVTGLGGLAMLAGFLLMGGIGGSLELTSLLNQGDLFRSHPYYLGILILVFAGAFTKSAQFPFHFWLPNAMAAPTPVSAYLHSATMVKAGIYLLARLAPVLGRTELWENTLEIFGGATMLIGAFLALFETDLKRLLAYSTVSALGIMVFLLGLGNYDFASGVVVFIVAHALYKGALFMVAGSLDHETGTRDVRELGGLFKKMPVTASAGMVAALSLAGLPPLFGFIAKEMFFDGITSLGDWADWWASMALITSIFLVYIAARSGLEPFFGKLQKTPKPPHEGPVGLWLGPAVLALLSLFLGLFLPVSGHPLIREAAENILGMKLSFKIALWHGFNKTLALSVVAITGGLILYYLRHGIMRICGRICWILRWGPERWYDGSVKALKVLAMGQTRFWQNGYLRFYIIMVVLTTLGLAGFTLLNRFDFQFPWLQKDIYPYEIILASIIFLAALYATLARGRLSAMAGVGVVGFGVAIAFILYGAPDLAMTQILVETLVVILLVLGFHHMPGFKVRARKLSLIRDGIISLAVGAFMTLLVLAATQVHFTSTVSRYYAEESLPAAHGRNIVNVILVDFRALDTLGEITVLALAALGVFAMLKLLPKKGGHL